MKILVTGAKGFLGKNLVAELKIRGIKIYSNFLEKIILHYLKGIRGNVILFSI